MSNYKHGDWYCKPVNEEEAKEIVERAVASGASNEAGLSGSGKNYYCYGVNHGVVFYGSEAEWVVGTEYSIEQVRELFPLPDEHTEQGWNGEGLPPAGVDCEYSIAGSKYKTCTFVGINSRKSLVIENESGELFQLHGCQIKFRPLRSERERWVYAACAVFHGGCMHDYSGQHFADAMGAVYDALKSGTLKAPDLLHHRTGSR